jgi:hypothetical protein
VIQCTVPQHSRDASAKNDIIPGFDTSNILPQNQESDRPNTNQYAMRPKTIPKYAVDCMCYVRHGIALASFSMAYACTQMTAKEGLKRFGKDAEDALLIELKQLDNLKVYSGVHCNDLTSEE